MNSRFAITFHAANDEDTLAAITAFKSVLMRDLRVAGVSVKIGGCPKCGGIVKHSGIPSWQNRSTCTECGHHFSK